MKPYIPKPCHEDWNAMNEKEKGRHCDVCSKVVVDFTKMNDGEIVDYFEQHTKQKTCGHFRSDQLLQKQKIDIDLAKLPKNIPLRSLLAACFISIFSSLFFISCHGNNGRTAGEIMIVDSMQTKLTDTTKSELIDGEVKMDTSIKTSTTKTCYTTKGDVIVEPQPPITGMIASPPSFPVNDSAKENIETTKTKGKVAISFPKDSTRK